MNGSLKQGFLGVFQKLIHPSHFINWVVLISRGPLGCFIDFASRSRDFAVCMHSWWELFRNITAVIITFLPIWREFMLHVNFVDCMEFVTELRGVFCEVLWLHKVCFCCTTTVFEIFRTSLIFSLWLVIIYMKKLHLSDWLKTSTLIMHHECRFVTHVQIQNSEYATKILSVDSPWWVFHVNY